MSKKLKDRMTRLCCLFAVGVLMVGLAGCRPGPDRYEYLIELPQGYAEQPETAWPLMLFLHGAGERGAELDSVKIHGPPKMICRSLVASTADSLTLRSSR